MQKRSLEELINTVEPAWPLVQEWIEAAHNAHNTVEVLQVDHTRAKKVLQHLQVTTRSPLGAIAYETGGLLIDHGWLRFLGSGNERMRGDLFSWNTRGGLAESQRVQDAFVVAYDVAGGFFALNGGAFPGKSGVVFYFAPDKLTWESLNMSYSQLLYWGIVGEIERFYQNMRWPGWEQDVSSLTGDQGFSIYPFLWADREMPLAERSRRTVSMNDLWKAQLHLAEQLKDVPAGTQIQVSVVNDQIQVQVVDKAQEQ